MNDFLKQFFRAQSGHDLPEEGILPGAKARQNAENQKRFTEQQAISDEINAEYLQKQAEELSKALRNHAGQYIQSLKESMPNLHLSASDPQRVPEPTNWLPRAEQRNLQNKNSPSFYSRWKVSGGGNVLSVRDRKSVV